MPNPQDGRPRPPALAGEAELIRRISPLIAPTPAVPFGDDMAGIDPASNLLWTTDVLMDGVDFDATRHTWREIGRKALGVSLSDCAAMGVRPVAALAALVLPRSLSLDAASDLMAGAAELARRYGCELRGGDTNTWAGATVVGFTVAGRPEPGTHPIRRDGARAGELVFVSGCVGGSLLGRHMTFEPRVDLGLQLARPGAATAMIDISDGLSLDLSRLAEASGCGALLDEAALEAVIHADARTYAAQTGRAPLEHALGDGEDFELIVCARAEHREALQGLGLLPIGRIEAEAGLRLRRRSGAIEGLTPRGWEHTLDQGE